MTEQIIQLGDLSDLADGRMRVFPEIGEHGVLVCRLAGELHAVVDNCSHRDAKLSEGRLRGTRITCPLHGAQFDPRDGSHQAPPATTGIPCFDVTETDEGATINLTGE